MAIIDSTYVQERFAQVGSNADATMLASAITVAQKLAEDWCGITFDLEAVVEYHDAEYHSRRIYLNKRNVDSTASFSLRYDRGWEWDSGSEVDTSGYTVDYDNGVVYLASDYPAGGRAWQVSYTGGWSSTTAPDLLKLAVGELAAMIYSRMKDGSLGVATDLVGDNRREYVELIPEGTRLKLMAFRRIEA